MFENLGIAVIQLIGFLGVFGFFIYQLLSDNKQNNSTQNSGNQNKSSSKKETTNKRMFFSKNSKIKEDIVPTPKRWFR